MAAVAKDTVTKMQRKKLAAWLLFIQVVLIVLFSLFSRYNDQSMYANGHSTITTIGTSYPAFQDVQLMLFVGFGLMFTFLKRYSQSAVGFNLLIASLTIQWAIFVHEMVMTRGQGVVLELKSLMSGDFAAVAVLISFGAVLGKLSPMQLTVMAMIEVIIYVINRYIGVLLFQASDVGSSMFVHMFGAYFGLAVARFTHQRFHNDHPQQTRTYLTDLTSMIGTLFLWICLPSFNGAMAHATMQERAITNTFFSMAACTLVTFAMMVLFSKDEKFSMSHLQQATLAGGVAIGTCADMMIKPYGAMIVGVIAAVISVLGFTHIRPCLLKSLNIHDTRGVHNVHGMPGLLAAIVSIITTAMVTRNNYGINMYFVFPAMIPTMNTTDTSVQNMVDLELIQFGQDRTAATQCGMQALAMVVTVALALIGGAFTGLFIRFGFCEPMTAENVFDDRDYWITSEEGMPIYQVWIPPPVVDVNGEVEETVELKPKAEETKEEKEETKE